MLRLIGPAAALLLGASLVLPAAAQSGVDLVKQAVEAQGGADALRAFKTITIKGEAKHWEPGQSFAAAGDARFLGDSTFTVTGDVPNRMVRTDWDRDMKYPSVERMKFSEILSPAFGVQIDDKGAQAPMSGIRLAALQRELTRGSPFLLLRALDQPQSIVALPDQQAGSQTLPAVTIAAGTSRFVVMFDRATKLPSVIRTRDQDSVYGDSNYDMTLSDWKTVGGAKIAHALSFKLDDKEVQRITYKEIAANPAVAADTFAVKDDVKGKAKQAAADAPYQWALRRMFLGRFLDSDAIIVPDGSSLKLVELAPNVQHVQGGTANNLIVNMKDGLVIVDAPYGELQSRWVIDAAKAKYPGKPIKQLVMSHHHMDHSGGTRAFLAEGAELVIPAQSRPFFEKMVAAKHEMAPDALAKSQKQPKITDVKDTMSIKDDTVELTLINIPNPHVDGMNIIHVVGPNLVWVTDLISPRGTIGRSSATVAVGDALRKANINNATIVGGHGTTAKQADIAATLAAN